MADGLEERLDRAASRSEIQQLVAAYAVAVDARDIESLASLFAPDVQAGADQQGRAAIGAWFDQLLRDMGTTIHLVSTTSIEFEDADHARGTVYCVDHLREVGDGGWRRGALQYWDRYERGDDGAWCFRSREFHRWYIVDDEQLTDRELLSGRLGRKGERRDATLPGALRTWRSFWAESPDV